MPTYSYNNFKTMEEVKKLSFKYCIVPKCTNTTRKTPDKVFFRISSDAKIRKQWCKVMRRENVSPKSCLYCCEDHFNVKEDTENYIEYKLMKEQGEKRTLRLKKGVLPHIFLCQKRRMPLPKERMAVVKMQRLTLVNEALSSEITIKSSVKYNKEKLCFCCQMTSSSTSLWSHSGDSETYGQLLLNCFCIKFASNNDDVICFECVDQLQAAVKFKQQVISAQNLQQNVNIWGDCSRSEQNTPINTLEDDTPGISDSRKSLYEVQVKIEPGAQDPQQNAYISKNYTHYEQPNMTVQDDETKYNKDFTDNESIVKIEVDDVEEFEVTPPKQHKVTGDCKNEKEGGIKSYPQERRKVNKRLATSLKDVKLLPEEYTKVSDSCHVCNLCNKTFKNKEYIVRHIFKIHRETPTEMCDLCNEKFFYKSQINKHLTEVHNLDLQWICNECDKVFYVRENLLTHLKVVHRFGKKEKCPHCDYTTYHLTSLKTHMKRYHTASDLIKPNTEVATAMASTVESSEGLQHKVQEVGFGGTQAGTPKVKRLRKQRRVNHIRVPKLLPEDYKKLSDACFVCSHCNKTSKQLYYLQRHVYIKHRGGLPEYCNICDQQFLSVVQLYKHKTEVHNLDYRQMCSACDKVFYTKNTLVTHMNKFHKLGDVKKCPHCDYTTYFDLKIHLESHSTEYKYQCTHCPKKYTRKRAYVYHVRTHTGDKRFVCKICDKRYGWYSGLQWHITAHHPNNIDEAKGRKPKL